MHRQLRHPLVIATALACAVVLATIAWWQQRSPEKLASYLHEQINLADESQAKELIPQLAKLAEPGISHLVALLDDSREEVRTAAHDALRDHLYDWTEKRSSTNSACIERLAHELAIQDLPHDPAMRVFVRQTALKIITQPSGNRANASQLLADCSAVLERCLKDRRERVEEKTTVKTSVEPQPIDSSLSVPLEPAPIVSPEPPVTSSLSDDEEPMALPELEAEPIPAVVVESVTPRHPGGAEIDSSLSADNVAEHLSELPTRFLMRHLHGVPAVVTAAEEQLRSRGFEDRTLQLARMLDDPDPMIRRRLVDLLPRATGVDSTSWLFELAADESSSVRIAAINLLSTSTNPATQKRLQEMRR